MLSESTSSELRVERDRLARRLAAINALLADDEASIPSRSAPKAKAGRPASATGLAALIRQATREAQGGCTVEELLGKITASGYKTQGKTPLRTRLTGELARMRGKGKLKRRGSLYYAPAAEVSEGAETAA